VLLERTSESVDSANVEVANLVLEQYANTLQSTPLLQLSRAKLSLVKLKSLWEKVQTLDTSSGGGHEAQAAKWCKDFQHEAANIVEQTSVRKRRAELSLLETETHESVLQQQAMAQSQILKVLGRDTSSLQDLLSELQDQFDSTSQTMQFLRQSAGETASRGGGADVQAGLNGLYENLGKAEGLVSAGSSEIVDILESAIQRRKSAEDKLKTNSVAVQAKLSGVRSQRMSLAQVSNSQAASSLQDKSLQDRYEQMCSWTLDDIEARKHREECEKDAIHAALIVLTAH